MIERDRQRISKPGGGAASALRVHELAVRSVVLTPRRAVIDTGLTEPPIYAAFKVWA